MNFKKPLLLGSFNKKTPISLQDVFFNKNLNSAISGLLLAGLLVGCSGGGGGPQSSITGTAAVGAPLAGASVTIFDGGGNSIATGTTNDDGSYNISIPAGAVAPLIIKVELSDQALYSVKSSAETGVANVSHLTNAVAATLSSSGNPAKLASEVAAGTASVSESALNAKMALFDAAIKPAVDAVAADAGATPGNFLTSAFSADGTGIDKVLDTVNVSLASYTAADGVAAASVEVAFNSPTALETAAEPTAINFSSNDVAAAVTQQTANINNLSLPAPGLPLLYQEFLSRMQACYDLPKAERASNGSITHQNCKDVFYNQDPSLYKDGGFPVGSNRFGGMLNSNASITISRAVKPFLLQNIRKVNGELDGRALVAYVGSDDEGNLINFTVVAKVFTLNGTRVLGAYGDQNPAEFYVNSEVAVLHHPFAANTTSDYAQSGYSIYAPVYAPDGKTLSTAILTTPKGNEVVMGRQTGRSTLRICKSSEYNATTKVPTGDCTLVPTFVQGLIYLNEDPAAPTRSPYQNFNIRKVMAYGKTADNTVTCTHFAYTANNNPVQPACPRTDDEIESHRAGGLWKLVLTYTDNSTVTLWSRHPARALSNRELLGPTGPNSVAGRLTEATIERFKDQNTTAVAEARAYSTWLTGDNGINNPVWAPAEGGYQFDWTVPEGGVQPRQVLMSGRVAYYGSQNQTWCRGIAQYSGACAADGVDRRPAFESKSRFKSNLRTKTMTCSLSDGSDISCAGVTGTWVDRNTALTNVDQTQATDSFATGAWMSYANLWTKDTEQRNLVRGYNFFTP